MPAIFAAGTGDGTPFRARFSDLAVWIVKSRKHTLHQLTAAFFTFFAHKSHSLFNFDVDLTDSLFDSENFPSLRKGDLCEIIKSQEPDIEIMSAGTRLPQIILAVGQLIRLVAKPVHRRGVAPKRNAVVSAAEVVEIFDVVIRERLELGSNFIRRIGRRT